MIKLTFWAKNNPHFAQLLITIGHLLTAFLCIQLGIRLLILGVECPNWVFYLLGELFILAVWLYPSKSDITAKPKRVIRRSFHAVFLTLGVLITTIEANRLTSIGLDESVAILENTSVNISPNTNSGVAKNVVYRTENQRIDNKVFRNKPAVQPKQGGLKKWLQKRLVNRYQNTVTDTDFQGLNILWCILLMIVIFFVEALLAGLVCNLSCSGAGALAVLVGVGGLLGLWALVTVLLRYIFKKMSSKKRFEMALGMVILPILIALILSR